MSASLKQRVLLSEFTPDRTLISRGLAKEMVEPLAGVDEIEIDCAGIEWIDPSFADQLGRVWLLARPELRITVTHAGETVTKMLKRAYHRADLPQPAHPLRFA